MTRLNPLPLALAAAVVAGSALAETCLSPYIKGLKDPEKINRFVAAVRAADVLLAKSTHGLLSTT